MITIEIDFEVFKSLTNLRTTEEMSYNDVLRELLKLAKEEQPIPTHKSFNRDDWLIKGVRFPAGTEFRASYKGRQYVGKVESGALWVNGKSYNSPSASAIAITGNSVNGWTFWKCRMPGQRHWRMIKSLRKQGRIKDYQFIADHNSLSVPRHSLNANHNEEKFKMASPEYEEMIEPLLCYIYFNGGGRYEVRPIDTYEPLADYFDLTQEERTRPRQDGYPGKYWHNRVQWTRQRLINQGYLDGSTSGIWRLTSKGVRRAAKIANAHEKLRET